MVKVIPLTRGAEALVDDEDYAELAKYNWHCTANGYAARRKTIRPGKNTIVYMHREILGITDREVIVDHFNHNQLDNRRSNLRPGTNQENMFNRRKKAKGVCYDSTHGKYKAYRDILTLGQPKRRVNLGTYLTEKAALAAVAAFDERNNL